MTTDTGRDIRIHRGAEAPELHASGAAVSDFGPHDELREIATRLASSECSLTRLLVHQARDEGGLSIAAVNRMIAAAVRGVQARR